MNWQARAGGLEAREAGRSKPLDHLDPLCTLHVLITKQYFVLQDERADSSDKQGLDFMSKYWEVDLLNEPAPALCPECVRPLFPATKLPRMHSHRGCVGAGPSKNRVVTSTFAISLKWR